MLAAAVLDATGDDAYSRFQVQCGQRASFSECVLGFVRVRFGGAGASRSVWVWRLLCRTRGSDWELREGRSRRRGIGLVRGVGGRGSPGCARASGAGGRGRPAIRARRACGLKGSRRRSRRSERSGLRPGRGDFGLGRLVAWVGDDGRGELLKSGGRGPRNLRRRRYGKPHPTRSLSPHADVVWRDDRDCAGERFEQTSLNQTED